MLAAEFPAPAVRIQRATRRIGGLDGSEVLQAAAEVRRKALAPQFMPSSTAHAGIVLSSPGPLVPAGDLGIKRQAEGSAPTGWPGLPLSEARERAIRLVRKTDSSGAWGTCGFCGALVDLGGAPGRSLFDVLTKFLWIHNRCAPAP